MTPRCSSGCGLAATHELIRIDGVAFSPPIYGCHDSAKVHGLGQSRRLTPTEFGLPRLNQRPTPRSARDVTGIPVAIRGAQSEQPERVTPSPAALSPRSAAVSVGTGPAADSHP